MLVTLPRIAIAISREWRDCSLRLASETRVMPNAKTNTLVANFICQRLKMNRMNRGVVCPLASWAVSRRADTA